MPETFIPKKTVANPKGLCEVKQINVNKKITRN